MREKGIFITFMAFLLVSTVLALSISVNQATIGQEQNLSNETAFDSVNSKFDNIRQQIIVVKEGYAGETYGRLMPFEKVKVGSDWIEIEQDLSNSDEYLKNAYDALNLFKIFAEEKASTGIDVEINTILQNTEWGGGDDYPEITYIVMPQCYKIITGGSSDIVKFEGGTVANGCKADFEQNSIKSYDAAINLKDYINVAEIFCQGEFSACSDVGDPELNRYTKIELVLEDCPNPCTAPGFDEEGKAVISTNLSENPEEETLVQVKYTSATNLQIRLAGSIIELDNNDKGTKFKSLIEFTNPIDEIILAPNQFEFGVKNEDFEICRATNEIGCD